MPSMRPTIADLLREAYEVDGRSLYAIAKGANLPYSVVFQFFKNGKGISLTTADKLVQVMNLEVIIRAAKKGLKRT